MEARPWQEVNEFYSNAVNGHSSLSALFGIQVGLVFLFLFFILYYFHNLYLYLFACDVYMLFFMNCICFCISYTRLMMLLPTFLIYVIFLNISITQLSLVSHNGVVEATRKQTQTQTQTRCFLNEILESTRW